ncbi:MAG: hypothetical protein HFE65_08215 [Clostridiales bacterium]|jgi:hypothetical protein|nr:hypothetical protein [Clostridiales bacterium]
MQKIKRGIWIIAALLLLLPGCGAVQETELDAVIEYLSESKEVRAYIYDSDTSMKFAPDDAFLALLNGEWTEKSGGADGEKVVSIIAGTQYEICFFSDGTAMIYYGYVDILERDRQYYTFSSKENVDKMLQYIEANGSVYEETTDEHANGNIGE